MMCNTVLAVISWIVVVDVLLERCCCWRLKLLMSARNGLQAAAMQTEVVRPSFGASYQALIGAWLLEVGQQLAQLVVSNLLGLPHKRHSCLRSLEVSQQATAE
eukprot:GHUV01027286.1.p1 GENE.GHUV01027286.1~~GHUV01027286.1.p1  ORF type:complete len:103 (-),score=26.00 GHUV01027286.1:251-559(-)